jgi:hypothetical protein
MFTFSLFPVVAKKREIPNMTRRRVIVAPNAHRVALHTTFLIANLRSHEVTQQV